MFHVSSTCVTGFVSFAFTICLLTLNRSFFRFNCIWHCLLTRHWFVWCQQHLYIGVILHYNSGSMAATLNISVRLFFTWVLCIYIILNKGCHILYIFGLNSTVYSNRVGVHLSSDQVTCYFMMDVDLYIVFYCDCVSKVSSNLPRVLPYDAIFLFNLICLLCLILLLLYYIWYCYFFSPLVFASYCSIHTCDCVLNNFLEQPYGRNSNSKCVHMLTRERELKNRS